MAVVIYFAILFKQPTANAGWIVEHETGCKSWSSVNFENRSFRWTGDCTNGIADGSGQLTLIRNGYQFAIFKGELSQGKPEGFGEVVWLDGDRFEGEYKDGLPNGFGRLYNDDGDYYEGNFENGIRSGQGTYWYEPESELEKYVGSWQDGKQNGQGSLFYRNGTQIKGTFRDGILTKSDH